MTCHDCGNTELKTYVSEGGIKWVCPKCGKEWGRALTESEAANNLILKKTLHKG